MVNIGSGNGLSTNWWQAITWSWANADLSSMEHLRAVDLSRIFITIQMFPLIKMHFKMSSAKWWPFSSGVNVIKNATMVFPLEKCYHLKEYISRKWPWYWICPSQVHTALTMYNTSQRKNIIVSIVAKGNYVIGDNSVRSWFAYASVQLFTTYPGLNVQKSKTNLVNDYNTVDEITQKFDSHLCSKDATDCTILNLYLVKSRFHDILWQDVSLLCDQGAFQKHVWALKSKSS